MRREVEEEQARAAADLQHTLRRKRENAVDRVIHPLAHLCGRYRLARVTADPTADVEGWIGERRGLVEDFVIMDHLPLRQLIFFEFPRHLSVFAIQRRRK